MAATGRAVPPTAGPHETVPLDLLIGEDHVARPLIPFRAEDDGVPYLPVETVLRSTTRAQGSVSRLGTFRSVGHLVSSTRAPEEEAEVDPSFPP